MTPKYDRTIDNLIGEIRTLSKSYPKGKSNQIGNRCDKLQLLIKKSLRLMNNDNEQTQRQVADRYNAKKAIFEAMTQGRHISLLDSREFEISQMHTTICDIRRDIEDKNLPFSMKDRWITFGVHNKRCKEYWLEERS